MSEIVSMYPSSTILSASSCRVHLALPCGGWEQASMISLASISAVIRGGRPGRECSWTAANPSSLKRPLIRMTVRQLTPSASAIAWLAPSLPPLAAISTILALVWILAWVLPELTNFFSWTRWSSVSWSWRVLLILHSIITVTPLLVVYSAQRRICILKIMREGRDSSLRSE
jgi:hypothetical protein